MNDREALQIYRQTGSHEAFRELVQQHTPMVYQACLRVLRDAQLAEDASQAVFLVLLQRAGHLSESATLAGWLHTVAVHCARNLQRSRLRRDRREEEARRMRTAATEDPDSGWEQLSPELDHALSELPAAQRDAVVLRYLCGLSPAEAAAECGCPKETLHTRTQRGLEQLRRRLGKRDVRLSALLLAGLLSQHAAHAAPEHLAASLFTACVENTGASQRALAVAAEVQRAMVMTKVKMFAAALTAIALLGALISSGTVWLARADEKQPVVEKTAPPPPPPQPAPATTRPARWRAPRKIPALNTAGQLFPLPLLSDKGHIHALFVAGMKRSNQELLLSTSADGGKKWEDATRLAANQAYFPSPTLAADGQSVYLAATDGQPNSAHGGALLFQEVSLEGKELQRKVLIPGSGRSRYLGKRILADGKHLVLLSAFEPGGNSGVDLLALTSADGGVSWTQPQSIRRGLKLGDLADPSPCSFREGATIGWFFADGYRTNSVGINLALSDDQGTTWREQRLPAIQHASQQLERVIPLAAAATADRVYLVVGAIDEDFGRTGVPPHTHHITYFMLSSADRCKTWGEAFPISPTMTSTDMGLFVSLSARDLRVAFAYTQIIGDNWQEGPMHAHVSLSDDAGASWTNLNAFSGVAGSTLLPQVLLDPATGTLHATALVRPERGQPFAAVRTYSQENAADSMPDWFDEKTAKKESPETF